jgi:predicted enzyme related to lactoylglutathione lyase
MPITDLVPFVNVTDVARSMDFYRHFGFAVESTFEPRARLQWCFLVSGRARLMLERVDRPIVAEQQSTLFYLYADDLDGLRERLVGAGIDAGPIVDGSPGPEREMRIIDPDGWCLMVAESAVLAS